MVTVLIAAGWATSTAAARREARTSQPETATPEAAALESGGPGREPGYPVPPLDLPHYHGAGLAARTGRAPAAERTRARLPCRVAAGPGGLRAGCGGEPVAAGLVVGQFGDGPDRGEFASDGRGRPSRPCA